MKHKLGTLPLVFDHILFRITLCTLICVLLIGICGGFSRMKQLIGDRPYYDLFTEENVVGISVCYDRSTTLYALDPASEAFQQTRELLRNIKTYMPADSFYVSEESTDMVFGMWGVSYGFHIDLADGSSHMLWCASPYYTTSDEVWGIVAVDQFRDDRYMIKNKELPPEERLMNHERLENMVVMDGTQYRALYDLTRPVLDWFWENRRELEY